jgi:hypothetical protein
MKEFNKVIQAQFDKMCKTGKLFRSSLTGQQVWDLYLKGFDKDPIFRDPESSVHNCNLCNNFIRRYGNIVSIDENYNIMTIFDVTTTEEYQNSADKASLALRSAPIVDVFFETFNELNSLNYEKCSKTSSQFRLGIDKNVKRYTKEEAELYGVVKPNEIYTFNHLHLSLPKEFVDQGGKSIESIMAGYRDAKNVFQRTMEEISIDTLNLVKDLIIQGSLLDGQTHLYKIEQMIPKKLIYDELSKKERDNYCWIASYKFQLAKFKNELIGVLCSELAEGKELNDACQSWNKRVDPANYMKAIAPITKKQIEEARKFVEENNYSESFNRRFATIDDIKVSEILHSNVGDGVLKSVSIFDSVKSTSTRHKRSEFDGVEEVSIEKFMANILPFCTSVEAYLTNAHEGNLVSLTTANNKLSKPIFKWNNNYSWTFNGNLAGKSQIKENVKSVGGRIEGILRCSLQWNDQDTPARIDFDLHCITPFTEIYYSNKRCARSGGWLDVDMINPIKIGIENITWQKTLPDGSYKFFVRNYSGHTNQKGFKTEIEFDGNTFNYHYPKSFTGNMDVATINVKNGVMSIIHHLPEISTSKDLYSLPTNEFHKVNLVCLSPNHWEENNIGNKHYFFMLDGCKCPTSIRSFHAENLLPELAQHRKVLEVLGNTTMINPSDKQLSGLGFNATVKDELIVRLQGSFKRVIKIRF